MWGFFDNDQLYIFLMCILYLKCYFCNVINLWGIFQQEQCFKNHHLRTENNKFMVYTHFFTVGLLGRLSLLSVLAIDHFIKIHWMTIALFFKYSTLLSLCVAILRHVMNTSRCTLLCCSLTCAGRVYTISYERGAWRRYESRQRWNVSSNTAWWETSY